MTQSVVQARFALISLPRFSALRVGLTLVLMLVTLGGSRFARRAVAQDAPVEVAPVSKAQEKLNAAIDRKMKAARMSDLQDVIDLCEEAIEEGFDDSGEEFAKELLSATLYERAQRLVESLADGKLDLAWARRRQLALDSLDQAVETNENDTDAYLLLAELHELPGGDKKQGLIAAGKAVELLEEDPVQRSLARMSLATFRETPEERLSDYELAVEDDPKNMDALRERGKMYLATDQVEKSLEDFKALLANDPSDVESVEIVSQLLAGQEKYDEAIELIDGAIESDKESPSGYILRANIEMAKKDFEPALADLTKALELDPRNLAALLTRAQVYSVQENYKEGLADVSRVLELRPGMVQAVILRSQIALAAEDYKQSLADLRRLLRQDPGNVGLRLQIAAVYVADERPSMGIDMYDQIIDDDKEEWEAFRGRGDAMLGLGNHAKALEDYAMAIQGMPEDTGLLNNYAWVLATSTIDDVRDGKKAVELAEKACKLTEYKKPHIVSTLAACYAEIGDFDKAVELSGKAIDLGEGVLSEQLAEELSSYRLKKPWRERQEVKEEGVERSDDLEVE